MGTGRTHLPNDGKGPSWSPPPGWMSRGYEQQVPAVMKTPGI